MGPSLRWDDVVSAKCLSLVDLAHITHSTENLSPQRKRLIPTQTRHPSARGSSQHKLVAPVDTAHPTTNSSPQRTRLIPPQTRRPSARGSSQHKFVAPAHAAHPTRNSSPQRTRLIPPQIRRPSASWDPSLHWDRRQISGLTDAHRAREVLTASGAAGSYSLKNPGASTAFR